MNTEEPTYAPPDLSDWEVLAGWEKRKDVVLTAREHNLLCAWNVLTARRVGELNTVVVPDQLRRWTDEKLRAEAKELFARAYVWIDPLGPLPTE